MNPVLGYLYLQFGFGVVLIGVKRGVIDKEKDAEPLVKVV
jgi:hypothetical protein